MDYTTMKPAQIVSEVAGQIDDIRDFISLNSLPCDEFEADKVKDCLRTIDKKLKDLLDDLFDLFKHYNNPNSPSVWKG